jgi:hypothetical protein
MVRTKQTFRMNVAKRAAKPYPHPCYSSLTFHPTNLTTLKNTVAFELGIKTWDDFERWLAAQDPSSDDVQQTMDRIMDSAKYPLTQTVYAEAKLREMKIKAKEKLHPVVVQKKMEQLEGARLAKSLDKLKKFIKR